MAAAPSTGAGADTPAIEGPVHDIASTAEPILRMLPEWFGVPAAVRGYLREMKTQPSWIAREADQVVGFLTLKQHFDQAAEILIMAVHPTAHGQGIGRALLGRVERYLAEQRTRFLQVKTLGPSHPDPYYAKTRQFYEATGFVPLEEVPALWDQTNPCLIMIKVIDPPDAS